jgi:phage terminase large subunit
MIEIQHSTVFTRIRKSDKRIIVNEGSSRSTKTVSICQYLIMKALESKIKITGARAKLTWAKATMVHDFLWVLEDHFKIYNPNSWNKTDSIYYFDNGSEFSFIGLDESQKLHGRKQDIAWINEAVESSQADFRQIALRTTKQIILDYNPSYESHWLYDTVIPRDDCEFIKSTYKDNPFLEPEIVREIESLEPTEINIKNGTADAVSWAIYGKGERAAHRGLIFSDWKIVDSLPEKDRWKAQVYGQDFGFSNDPSAMFHIIYADGELWVDELIYEKGLTNIKNPLKPEQRSLQELYEKHSIPKNVLIWADPAEPKSIEDLSNCGYFIKGATKGPDSVMAGIKTLKRFKVNVTSRSINLIKEKANYKWKEDRSGKVLEEPIDLWNHGIDAIRYAVFMEFKHLGEPNAIINPNDRIGKKPMTFLQKVAKPQKEGYFV